MTRAHAGLAVTSLTPTIGAEIALDLRTTSRAQLRAIKQLACDRGVVFFRNQALSAGELQRFASSFGPLSEHPNVAWRHPELRGITLVNADERSTAVFGEGWHTDQPFQRVPPVMSTLYVLEAPTEGGDTLWASTFAAYEALSPTLRQLLEGLTAFHNGNKPRSGYVMAPTNSMLHNEHPVVIRHPGSTRRALYVNRATTTHIPQLEWRESEALLRFLYDHVEQPKFQCRFRWTSGTLALWDNRCTQHTVVWDYHPAVRRALRATISGPAPAAADPRRAKKSNQQVVRMKTQIHKDFRDPPGPRSRAGR